MKVYLVTTGSYSDYSIRGVFLDKALAEKLVRYLHNDAGYSDDQPSIEEHEADEPVPDKLGWLVWSNGGVEVAQVFRTTTLPCDDSWVGWKGHVVRHDNRRMSVNVLADDEAHATKIAADKFREFIATGG